MVDTIHDELLQVELLIENEKNKDALKLVENILQKEGLSVNNQLACKLLESRIRVRLGEIDKARKSIEKMWPKVSNQENHLLIMDYLIIETNISWISGDLDQGLKALEKGKLYLEKSDLEFIDEMKVQFKRRKSELLQHCGVIYWYKGNLDKALDYHQESLKLSEELGDKIRIANSYNNLGLVYFAKSDYKKAIDCHKRSLEINENLCRKLRIARVLNNLGNVYSQQGDLDHALEYYQKSYEIKEEYGTKIDIVISLINLGVVYQFKGELDQSLDYYQRALTISKEIDNKLNIALANNNIGNIYNLKGDLDQAFKYYELSFKLYKELDMNQQIALSLLNLGEYYKKKGDIKKAIDYYNQSLKLYEQMGNDFFSAQILYDLILIALDRNDTNVINKYLQRLNLLNKQTKSRQIDQHYRIANALSLKASDNPRDKMKASVIFEQIINEEITDHSLTVTAMVHLCDLLLSELKITGDSKLFIEIKNLTHKLLNIAKNQTSYSLLVETYRLEALLALAELDLKKSKQLFNNALEIANEKGLVKIAENLRIEQQRLDDHIGLWEELINRDAPLKETLKNIPIEKTIKEIQNDDIIINKRLFSIKL